MNIETLFNLALDNGASDLHLRVGLPPILRIDGRLKHREDFPLLTNIDIKQMLDQITSQEQRDHLSQVKELDFSYELELKARFRINQTGGHIFTISILDQFAEVRYNFTAPPTST